MIKHFEENTIGKDYVVGDIHGCFGKLQNALWLMGFDESKDRLFSVGDLVDRGPESEEAIDWLAKPWFHAVRGNHEQMAIDYVNGLSDDYYEHNGGGWMIQMKKEHQPLYRDVFNDLPLAIDIKAGGKLYGIVHADPCLSDWNALVEALEGSDGDAYGPVLMWSRDRYNYKDTDPVENVELVYVGHTPLKKVVKLGNVVFIDTGAVFKNGSMTIVELTKENV